MVRERFGRPTGWALAMLGLSVLGTADQAQAQAVAPAPSSREAELEERVRQLEATVKALSERIQQMPVPPPSVPSGESTVGTTAATAGAGAQSASGGAGPATGASTPTPAAPPRFNVPAANRNDPLKASFGPGFQLKSDDDEFVFQFHNLTQFDARVYNQGGQDPVHDTFTFPRQRFIFSGRVTKPIEYQVSIQHGIDAFSLLDAFINVHYWDQFQVKIGRFKSPFAYEFYAIPNQFLIHPERSLFTHNFHLQRDLGVMAWGQLFEKRVDYAVGIFNGTENGLLDTNDSKDLAAYVNVKPFGDQENTWLENLNVGGSVNYGNQLNIPRPQTLRTQIPISGAATIGVPFLTFRDDVREAGDRTFWTAHMAYYFEQLSLIAEWESGFQDFAHANQLGARTNLPIDSFYVQAGYFLTGETVGGRGPVMPLRPFDLRPGRCSGPGAIELAGRYSYLDLGDEVFTHQLADRGVSSDRAYLVDLGVNWYWNQYVRIYLGWEHAEFGDPVRFAPDRNQLTSDMFWMRFQLYF